MGRKFKIGSKVVRNGQSSDILTVRRYNNYDDEIFYVVEDYYLPWCHTKDFTIASEYIIDKVLTKYL